MLYLKTIKHIDYICLRIYKKDKCKFAPVLFGEFFARLF